MNIVSTTRFRAWLLVLGLVAMTSAIACEGGIGGETEIRETSYSVGSAATVQVEFESVDPYTDLRPPREPSLRDGLLQRSDDDEARRYKAERRAALEREKRVGRILSIFGFPIFHGVHACAAPTTGGTNSKE